MGYQRSQGLRESKAMGVPQFLTWKWNYSNKYFVVRVTQRVWQLALLINLIVKDN